MLRGWRRKLTFVLRGDLSYLVVPPFRNDYNPPAGLNAKGSRCRAEEQ